MAQRRGNDVIDWQSLAKTIHKGIVKLREEESFLDFTVEVGNKSFRCHKVVLAAMSDYFKAMFSSGMKETEMNKAVLDDVNPDTFQIVMQILYPEKDANPLIKPSEDDMSDLLKLSGRFQMPFLKDICLKYFRKTMSEENCISRWKLGKQFMCEKLTNLGYEFMKEHFEEMVADDSLVSLEFEDFLVIIQDETMHVKREDVVWSAIQSWIQFDREERHVYIAELLRECCLTEIDPDIFMEEIVFDSVVRKSDKASSLLQEVVKFKLHPGIHGDIELKSRECHEKRQVTLLFTSQTNSPDLPTETTAVKGFVVCSNKSYRLDINKKLLYDIERMEEAGFSCCVHGQSVYVLTGIENGLRGSQLWQYKDNDWIKQRDMDLALSEHTMSAADGCLYVVGGKSSRHLNAQVWQYSIATDSWILDGDLMAAVLNASSVCVKNKIYVFGGRLEDNEPAQCIQVYDTQKREGTIVGNLPKPCSWSRALLRGSTAIVVTSDGDVVKVMLETGETTTTTITSIPNFRRVNFGINLQRNQLYIFGGRDIEHGVDVEKVQVLSKRSMPIKGDFVINIETGEVKSSKWFQRVGIKDRFEVLANVLVVLDPTE